MKIMPLNFNSYTHNFKGNFDSTISELSSIGSFNHETYLFREPKTDEFVQNYVRKKFADNPEISLVSGACSSGEEAMSYLVMLDDLLDKLKISAFDVNEKILEDGKNGKVYVSSNSIEGCLLGRFSISNFKKKCVRKFHRYFSSTGTVKLPKIDSYLQALKILYPDQYRTEIKKLSLYEYQLDEKLLKKIDFRCCDVRNIDDTYKENSVDILLFRNAMYHILCEYDNETDDRVELPDAQEIADSVAKKMYKIIRNDGLVVFGEKENRQGIHVETIEKAMRKAGFKSIDIEPDDMEALLNKYISGYEDNSKHYHVWQKIDL